MSIEPFVTCSSCFIDEGLRLDAEQLGEKDSSTCPRCSSIEGCKLTSNRLAILAQNYFVWGSTPKLEYGAAPLIQFNDRRKSDYDLKNLLTDDIAIFEEILGVGFFWYGPRLWLLGEVIPLKELQNEESRPTAIRRILCEYETRILTVDEKFYRVRKDPCEPSRYKEYDSPLQEYKNGKDGRLDTPDLPVLYASPDLQTCLHECRVTAEDDLYVATLRPTRDLKLLDLTILLDEPREVDEFESLDLAVYMLFLAGEYSYPITRELSSAAQNSGIDGLIFPSYFSMLRNGVKPFETTYGMSHRKLSQFKEFEKAKLTANYAIFGRPIQEGLITVSCINRVILSGVHYSVHFGPVIEEDTDNNPEIAINVLKIDPSYYVN